jgi:branched-chain amino acid transport system ATP-binding protein
MARSFQITSLFMGFTVRENIELAVQAVQGSSYRFWQPAVRDSELRKPAREIMARVGLLERAEIRAENLAHGEQRLLEMGMALATRPSLLLLDEPMAGLGPGSSRNLAELIRGLKGNVTILLVEHDMNAVFSLADRITVLVQGRIIATDSPRKIRNNPVVQEAYLGTAC